MWRRILLVLSVAAVMAVLMASTAPIAAAQHSDTYCGDTTYRTYTFSDGVWYQGIYYCFDPNIGWHSHLWGWDGPY
jgi:hypothetical protein